MKKQKLAKNQNPQKSVINQKLNKERKNFWKIGRRTQQDIFKGKNIRKYKDGTDIFEDYWTDSVNESSTFSTSALSKMSNVQSSDTSKVTDSRNSFFKQKIAHLPLKSKINSPLRSKHGHRPRKSKKLLLNSSVNRDKVANENREASTTVSEAVAKNLEVQEDNLEVLPEEISANVNENDLSPESSKLSFNRNNDASRLESRKSFKTSRKSVSSSREKNEKITEKQLQLDKCDEKIMQMIHTNNDETQRNTTASDKDMSLIQEKVNFAENEYQNQNYINNSMPEMIRKQVKNDTQERNNTTDHCPSETIEDIINYISNSSEINEKQNQNNVHDRKNDAVQHPLENMSEKSLPCSHEENFHFNETENTDDVINYIKNNSLTKIIGKQDQNNVQERKNDADQYPSEALSEKSLPCSAEDNSDYNRSELHNELQSDVDCRSKSIREVNETSYNSENVFESISVVDDISKVNNVKKQKTIKKNNGLILNNNIHNARRFPENSFKKIKKTQKKTKNNKSTIEKTATKSSTLDESTAQVVLDSLSQSQMSERQKTRNTRITGKNHSSVLSNCSKNSIATISRLKKNATHKAPSNRTNRSAFDESIAQVADIDSLSQSKISERRQRRNISVMEGNYTNVSQNCSKTSINAISRFKKITKKWRKIKSVKSKTARNKKNISALDEGIVQAADIDNLSLSRLSVKKLKRNSSVTEKSYAKSSLSGFKNSVTAISKLKKITKKLKKVKNTKSGSQKASANRKSNSALDKGIAQVTDYLSQSQISKIRKTNDSFIVKGSDHVNVSQNSVNNVSIAIENIAENQTDKSTSDVQKTRQKKRNLVLSDGSAHEITDLDDLSQQPVSKKQKISANKRSSYMLQKDELSHPSMNSSEKSVNNNIAEFHVKSATKKQRKTENKKNRHLCDDLNKENVNIRKSIRQRFPPLAHWRNERLMYRFVNGTVETVGIDRGTKEDVAFLQCLYKRKENQKQKILKPKKAILFDASKNKKKCVHLHKKFPLVSWDLPNSSGTDKNPHCAYMIKKVVETEKSSFGYIAISPGKSKPLQYLPEEDLLLTAIEGKLEIHILKDVFILDKRDMFVVPQNSPYSIKNIGVKKALLSYAVGKFNFLKSL